MNKDLEIFFKNIKYFCSEIYLFDIIIEIFCIEYYLNLQTLHVREKWIFFKKYRDHIAKKLLSLLLYKRQFKQ